jgi:hypothetical protein
VHVSDVTALEHKPGGKLLCDAGSPGAPGQNQLLAVTNKRTAANRLNALKSTGPRTKAGKLTVARNSVGHGIYTLCPVIPEVESAHDWKRYRKGMLASFMPSGMLETTFAERITLTAWRLRRVMRYESEQIRLTQEDARAVVVAKIHRNATQPGHSAVQKLEFSLLEIVAGSTEDDEPGYDEVEVRDDTELDEANAQDLLWQFHDRLGRANHFDDYWRQLTKPEAWTAGLVRQLVRQLADVDCQRREQGMGDELTRGLDEYRCEHLLPDEDTMEKVMRYEAHLSRQLHRDLHELQRLQAMRQGQDAPVPIAIDVDVAGDSETAPKNGG